MKYFWIFSACVTTRNTSLIADARSIVLDIALLKKSNFNVSSKNLKYCSLWGFEGFLKLKVSKNKEWLEVNEKFHRQCYKRTMPLCQ